MLFTRDVKYVCVFAHGTRTIHFLTDVKASMLFGTLAQLLCVCVRVCVCVYVVYNALK